MSQTTYHLQTKLWCSCALAYRNMSAYGCPPSSQTGRRQRDRARQKGVLHDVCQTMFKSKRRIPFTTRPNRSVLRGGLFNNHVDPDDRPLSILACRHCLHLAWCEHAANTYCQSSCVQGSYVRSESLTSLSPRTMLVSVSTFLQQFEAQGSCPFFHIDSEFSLRTITCNL